MSEPTVIPPGAGEVIGDTPDRRVEILAGHDALHATWTRFGPRRDGADLHVHHRHTDLFYVLDGEMTVMLGPEGEDAVVPAGTLARVPPLVVHGFRNGTDAELRYLNFHAPGRGFAAYMRGIRDGRPIDFDQDDPPADGGRPAAEAVVGGGELVADRPGLRVVLHADVEEIAISETWCDPGGLPSSPHLHRRHVESFYLLEGELALTAGDRGHRAKPGSWLQVPSGIPHALSCSEPVRFLAMHTPSCGFGAFVRALDETGGEEDLAAARAGFDQERAAAL